jgi:Delta7-sterol 5-desaturase
MNALLDFFWDCSPAAIWGWCLLENVLLLLASLAVGHALVRLYRSRPVTDPPRPLERREVALAVACVACNTIVTVAGWWLWKLGVITVRRETGWRTLLDAAVLLVAMDFAMYWLHRAAHWRPAYRLVHVTHHLYDNPRPLNLFVLNPFEVFGFGALWLAVIAIYPSTWGGMLLYLALNLAFGTLGHLGVEPFPRRWSQIALLRHIGTSTFHAGHHQDEHHNFGFYTLVWDRLFGTLRPQSPDAHA